MVIALSALRIEQAHAARLKMNLGANAVQIRMLFATYLLVSLSRCFININSSSHSVSVRCISRSCRSLILSVKYSNRISLGVFPLCSVSFLPNELERSFTGGTLVTSAKQDIKYLDFSRNQKKSRQSDCIACLRSHCVTRGTIPCTIVENRSSTCWQRGNKRSRSKANGTCCIAGSMLSVGHDTGSTVDTTGCRFLKENKKEKFLFTCQTGQAFSKTFNQTNFFFGILMLSSQIAGFPNKYA